MFKKAACILLAAVLLSIAFAGCDEMKTEETYPGKLTSILIMGSMNGDFSNENNQNYALTHILITIDPATRSMRFTTFPYNMKVKPVLDEDVEATQLQFLYSDYGADVVVDTLSQRFDIEIDGWVVMNMHGVKDIVDALGGLEIKISDLSVNEMAETVEMILGYVWQEIKEKGKQTLNGIQISGHFMDTYHDLDKENPTKDEEIKFRAKHESIIDALIMAVNALKIDEKKAVEIANMVEENFLTDIKEKDWNKLAKMALACAQNDQEYLHVPKVINVEEEGYFRSLIYDEVKDVEAVSAFVRGE